MRAFLLLVLFLCLLDLFVQGKANGTPTKTTDSNDTQLGRAVEKISISGENNKVTISLATPQKKVIGKLWSAIGSMEKRLVDIGKENRRMIKRVRETLDQKVASVVKNTTSALHDLRGRISRFRSFELRFPAEGVTDYVKRNLSSSGVQLHAFTACLWYKSKQLKSGLHSLISYAARGDNELLLATVNGKFKWWHSTTASKNTQVTAASDNGWQHICLTWENSHGTWILYKDGKAAEKGTGFRKGGVIRKGGVLVLGQEQDTVGGTFDKKQSFVGHLSGVNIWSRALAAREISRMSVSCDTGKGDVFKWRDALDGIHGHVEIIYHSPGVIHRTR